MMAMKRIFCAVLLGLLLIAAYPSSTPAQIGVGISVHIGPPALPVYAQPVCPGPGYLWTPGYWAYGPAGYFWVPGTWVVAPAPGFLWTPGYWGWGGGAYVWHAGYWGPHVGFYGGINYGFGYTGVGFVGGEWRGGVFAYNRAVTNVNTTVIHNTYVNNTVINKTVVNNVSYNGGTGGTTARPTSTELAAANEHHIAATSMQARHEEMARNDRTMLASENHGRPAIAATPKPGVFHGAGVAAARPANANHPDASAEKTHNARMQNDRPPSARNANSYQQGGADRPNAAAQTHTQTPQGSHGNANKGNPDHPNHVHSENNHPNNPHPNEQNHAQPSHDHENGGRPGGHTGR